LVVTDKDAPGELLGNAGNLSRRGYIRILFIRDQQQLKFVQRCRLAKIETDTQRA
jgi:hypothetical protein